MATGVPSWSRLRAIDWNKMPYGVDGCRLRRKSEAYPPAQSGSGWRTWKPESLTADAVLIYAHPGKERRGDRRGEYTFAVWDGETLVPVARLPLPTGFDRLQLGRLERHLKSSTVDRFGPVRAVRPDLVFELAFEGVSASRRRKSGLVLRAPSITKLHPNKRPKEADSLESLFAHINCSPPKISHTLPDNG